MHTLRSRGFALPTVLIASVVLLTVLAVSVTATAAVRTSLKNQYYAQLAQAAGEAGVAYAKACLAENENEPLWSDASPLRPNTDCSGNEVPGYSDTVMSNGNVRSKFSVGLPTLDANGKAVTIPNNGYVEIIRTSNGSIWRTYTQPTVQAAVVPDLCSGQATSALGWNNAYVVTSDVESEPITGAQPIAINSSNAVPPGPQYFRKDFTVTRDDTYVVTASAGGTYQLFIDGKQVISYQDSTSTTTRTVELEAGCHTIDVRLFNWSLNGTGGSDLRMTLRREGTTTPIVTTDSSWRTAAGSLVDFGSIDFHQLSSSWATARDIGYFIMAPWTGGPTNWTALTGDASARWVSTNHNYSGLNYPASKRTYFINNNIWDISSPTEYKFAVACDDACILYVDGVAVLQSSSFSSVTTANVTLPEGKHRISLELSNGGVSTNASAFLYTVSRTSDGAVVESSHASAWTAVNNWYSSPTSFTSYGNDFTPQPYTPGTSSVETLLVGGGGGGGGNCTSCGGAGGGGAGGVLHVTDQKVTVTSYPVVVGTGGAGGPAGDFSLATGNGQNGGNSSFAGLIAFGGGAGLSQNALPGIVGGSGGGGSGGGSPSPGVGGAGLFGQGNSGGAGIGSPYGGGGGGGAGGAGGSGSTKAGGVGKQINITGSNVYYGGGGGGGAYSTNTGGVGGNGGGGNGANQNVNNGNGYPGTANTGGGGGGANGTNKGGAGGAGGSGIVIIRYPTGSIVATGGTITTSGGYTIHTFTSSGTFTVTQIN